MEARVAMVNAHVDGTSEFTLSKVSDVPVGSQGPAVLNKISFVITQEHLSRLIALSKTGKWDYILCILIPCMIL